MSTRNRGADFPSAFPPVQPLLFRQAAVLLFIAGLAAARFPVAAACAGALILWADGRTRRPACLAAALCCALAGWGTGRLAEPPAAVPLPSWLAENPESRRGVRISGDVESVAGLAGRRLRVVLANVRPQGSPAPPLPAAPLPAKLAWTWEQPPENAPRPLPGQRLTATLRIRPVRGFRNEGGWDSEDYWHRRGVFFQSWSRGTDSAPVYERKQAGKAAGPGVGSGRDLRERLRRAVVAVFAPPAVATAAKAAPAPPPGAADRAPAPGWTLLPALLFGDRFYLATPDVERLGAAGLAHSMALSGQHLAVVGLLALAVASAAGRLVPRFFLRLPAGKLVALCSLPPAALYLWLGDAPPSLIRAALMLAFWAAFICFNRPAAFPDALMAALACMVLASPLSVYDIGVQLSFAAAAGLALFSPLLRRLWGKEPLLPAQPSLARRGGVFLLRCLRLTLGCSLVVQVATWPLVMEAFGRSSWWFPLNLLWLPVLGFFVLPLAFLGLAAVGCGLTAGGGLLLHLAALPCDALLQGLARLETDWGMSAAWGLRPHWTGVLGFAAVLVGAALLQGRCAPHAVRRFLAGPAARLPGRVLRRPAGRLLTAGLVLLSVGPLLRLAADRDPRLTLRVLDVGQGQAVLVEWPGAHGRGRALVDGGGFFSDRFDSGRDVIAPVLTANREPALDFVALSHPDRDHLRGLLFIASRFDLGAAYTAPLPETASSAHPLYRRFADILAARGIPRRSLRAGDSIPLAPDVALEVLAPAPGERPSGNNGLVLRLVAGGKGLAFLPGDAEAGYLRDMLRRCGSRDLRAEVLILPHHGSAGSFLPALYDAVRPAEVVISSGAANAYRLPARNVLDELARRGLPVHNTAELGEYSRHWEPEESKPRRARLDGRGACVY